MATSNAKDPPAAPKRKPGSGGKRKGAGRPKGSTHVNPQWKRVRISLRLPQCMVDWLNDQERPIGRTIEDCIEEHITAGLNLE